MANDEVKSGIWTSPISSNSDLVDEVLAEKNAVHATQGFSVDTRQELEAVVAELDRVRESIQEIASSSKRISRAAFEELKLAAEAKLTQNIFLSVGVAALFGYLWGRAGR